MVKSEVKQLLNNRQANFQFVLKGVGDYVRSLTVFAPTVNKIIKKAQTKQNLASMDLFVFFYEEMKDLVEGTKYCPNKYSAQMLLKSVWEHVQLQTFIVQQIRKGYVLLEEPEDIEVIEEKPKKKTKKKETPEEKKERLKRQAEAMRIAKAKKSGKDPEVTKKEEPAKQQAPQPTPQPTPQPQQKELTPEQLEQLQMLKNLKI